MCVNLKTEAAHTHAFVFVYVIFVSGHGGAAAFARLRAERSRRAELCAVAPPPWRAHSGGEGGGTRALVKNSHIYIYIYDI